MMATVLMHAESSSPSTATYSLSVIAAIPSSCSADDFLLSTSPSSSCCNAAPSDLSTSHVHSDSQTLSRVLEESTPFTIVQKKKGKRKQQEKEHRNENLLFRLLFFVIFVLLTLLHHHPPALLCDSSCLLSSFV